MQVLKNSTEMYSEKDLFVGKTLSVHQRTFELLEADEFTYQYMENNRHVYLMADWEAALKAIQAQLQGTLQVLAGSTTNCVLFQLSGLRASSVGPSASWIQSLVNASSTAQHSSCTRASRSPHITPEQCTHENTLMHDTQLDLSVFGHVHNSRAMHHTQIHYNKNTHKCSVE